MRGANAASAASAATPSPLNTHRKSFSWGRAAAASVLPARTLRSFPLSQNFLSVGFCCRAAVNSNTLRRTATCDEGCSVSSPRGRPHASACVGVRCEERREGVKGGVKSGGKTGVKGGVKGGVKSGETSGVRRTIHQMAQLKWPLQ